MEQEAIEIQYPVLDHTESVANIGLETIKIDVSKKVTIKDAELAAGNNLLFLVILNKANHSSALTFKAGDAYPNSMLGDVVIELPIGYSAINLADMPRFIKSDKSFDLSFDKDFDGEIFAIGKWSGMKTPKVDW